MLIVYILHKRIYCKIVEFDTSRILQSIKLNKKYYVLLPVPQVVPSQ